MDENNVQNNQPYVVSQPVVIKKKNPVNILLVILSVVLLIAFGVGAYFYTQKDTYKTPVYSSDQSVKINKPELTKEQAKEIAQVKYEEAYNLLGEGAGLTKDYKKTIKDESSNLKDRNCLSADFSILPKFFTDKAQHAIASKYSPVGDSYYSCNETEVFWLSSIFGVTNQGKRDLQIVVATDDLIVATGKLATMVPPEGKVSVVAGDIQPHYIIFKKVNDDWLIDFFE